MENEYDAIVVGAGPSGSSCACLLACSGAKVLLIDKQQFPRDKVCGDAIGGKAQNVLEKLGLLQEIGKKGFLRSSGLVFSSPSGKEAEIQLKEGPGRGFVCKRAEFDTILFSHAKQMCDVLEKCTVIDLLLKNGKVCGVKAVKEGKEAEYLAKVIIGADGVSSVVAAKTGCLKLDPKHTCSALRGYYTRVKGLRKNIEVHFLPECMPGYFWIFPLSENEANVGVGMLVSDIMEKKLNLQKVFDNCIKSKRIAARFVGAVPGKVSGWSIPLASAKRKCAGNGFVLLGDAASLVDPFSGEGMGNGMKSAAIAAKVLGDALKRGEITEQDCLSYEKMLWEEIGDDVKSSYNMQKLGKNSFLLDFVIGKAEKSKQVREEIGAMITDSAQKSKTSDPMFYLRMLFA